MRKIIYITGGSCNGKTTISQQLSEKLNIPFFSVDNVYQRIGEKNNYARPDRLVLKQNWNILPNMKEMKESEYRKILEIIPRDQDIILEGFPLSYKEDRDIINDIIGDHKKIFFHIALPFKIWNEYVRLKMGKPTHKGTYDFWNNELERPEDDYNFLEVSDLSLFLTHYEKYQREGFTDKKIELLKLNQEQVSGKDVIDLGCNSGWVGRHCLSLGAKMCAGVDYNWRYLSDAIDNGLKPYLAKFDEFEFDKKYDVVICLAAFHYVGDKDKFFKKMADNTNEMLIIEVPISDIDECALIYKDRRPHESYFIPTINMMKFWIEKYFKSFESRESVAPDQSKRLIFKCYK